MLATSHVVWSNGLKAVGPLAPSAQEMRGNEGSICAARLP